MRKMRILRSQKKVSVVTDTSQFEEQNNFLDPCYFLVVGDDRQFFLAAKYSHL